MELCQEPHNSGLTPSQPIRDLVIVEQKYIIFVFSGKNEEKKVGPQ